jgi:hypothetical protein
MKSSHTDTSQELLHFISQHVHTPKALAAFFSTKQSPIVLGFLVSFLHRLSSCSTNLATYQTQRKIQDIAEAPSYKSPSFFSKSSPLLITQSTHMSVFFSSPLSVTSIFSPCSPPCSFLLPPTHRPLVDF